MVMTSMSLPEQHRVDGDKRTLPLKLRNGKVCVGQYETRRGAHRIWAMANHATINQPTQYQRTKHDEDAKTKDSAGSSTMDVIRSTKVCVSAQAWIQGLVVVPTV